MTMVMEGSVGVMIIPPIMISDQDVQEIDHDHADHYHDDHYHYIG